MKKLNKNNPCKKEKKIKMQTDIWTTEAMKESFRKFKKEFRVTWETIMIKGTTSLIKERADINTSVMYGSYVLCYRTKHGKYVIKQRRGTVYTPIFIYWVSRASVNRINVYHSVGEPLTSNTGEWAHHASIKMYSVSLILAMRMCYLVWRWSNG